MKYDMPINVIDNATNNIKEMKEKKTVLSSLPFKLFVEPTQRCNHSCFMCWDDRECEASKAFVFALYCAFCFKRLFCFCSNIDKLCALSILH